jgi:hypothetical protein
MLGWEYNKKMLQTYMTDHAEDIGRFWGEVYRNTPKIYMDFSKGFFEEITKPTKKE